MSIYYDIFFLFLVGRLKNQHTTPIQTFFPLKIDTNIGLYVFSDNSLTYSTLCFFWKWSQPFHSNYFLNIVTTIWFYLCLKLSQTFYSKFFWKFSHMFDSSFFLKISLTFHPNLCIGWKLSLTFDSNSNLVWKASQSFHFFQTFFRKLLNVHQICSTLWFRSVRKMFVNTSTKTFAFVQKQNLNFWKRRPTFLLY